MDVRLPDGTIVSNVPDGITKAELVNKLTANGMGHLFATPQDKAMADPTGSFTENALAGAGKAFSDTGRGVAQVFGANNQSAIDESRRLDAPLMKTWGGMAGNLLGNLAITAPAMAIPGVNTYLGAAAVNGGLGFLQPTATGESRGMNTAIGAGSGLAGQAVGNLIGRVLQPVRSTLSPEGQRLAGVAAQEGIPLSAAQQTGSRPLQIIDSVMENLPFTSGPALARREAQQTAFNRAVGRTFGAGQDALTPDVVGQARRQIGNEFTNLANRNTLDATGNMLPYQLGQVLGDIGQFQMPDVARVVTNRANDLMSRMTPNGQIPGRAYRTFDSAVGRQMRGTTNGDLRESLGRVRDVVRNAMDASISPADQAAWREARRQYGNMMTVAPIAGKNELGDVSGRTLLQAANTANSNAKFGGPSQLAELGRVGRAFIADKIPNSGTAQRLFYQNVLTGSGLIGAGAAGGAAADGDWLKGAGYGALALGGPRALQAMMNSGAGQRYLTQGLVQMTPQRQAIINALARAGLLTQAVQQ